MLFSLASCAESTEKTPGKTEANQTSYEKKGSGETHFYLDIAFESDEKHYDVHTNQKTVGAALEELKIIKGEQGPYGIYISSVEGEEHVYENGGKYWAIYIGNEPASQGIDLINIEDGQTYALKVE